MSIETYQFNLPITPGSIPPVLHLSQYDSGRTFTAILRDDQGVPFELDASATAVIKGRNAAGIAWQQDCTVSGANVTFTPSGAATDQFGVMPVTIEITESEEVISPLCVVFHIQKAGYTNEEAVLSPDFETAIQAAVAQAISEGGLGFSDEFKEALLACFNGVAWATTGGQALVDDLEAALYPEVHLVSITAAYDQDRPIYDTDSLDLVRLDLVVTANYSDGTSEQLADDAYTLTGTLVAPSSTITVGYGGKTAEIEVIVTGAVLPEGYTRIEYVERPSGTGTSGGYNTTGFMLNGTDDAVIKMGVMLKATPFSDAGGYFLACRQTNNNNTVGFGIYALKDTSAIGAFDGESCLVPPHSGQSVIDQKFNLVVTKTPTTLTVADGVNTNTITRTPRVMVQNLHVFGLVQYNASQLSNPVVGRIYYLNIIEGGVEKVNFIPCVRNSDNAVGFWNSVAEEFKTSLAYVAGPEV